MQAVRLLQRGVPARGKAGRDPAFRFGSRHVLLCDPTDVVGFLARILDDAATGWQEALTAALQALPKIHAQALLGKSGEVR